MGLVLEEVVCSRPRPALLKEQNEKLTTFSYNHICTYRLQLCHKTKLLLLIEIQDVKIRIEFVFPVKKNGWRDGKYIGDYLKMNTKLST